MTDSTVTWSAPKLTIINPPGIVTVGKQYEDTQSGTLPQSAGFIFKTDGRIQAYANGTPVDIGRWWSKAPQTAVGDGYQVRCASIEAGSSWDFSAAAVGTWVTMDADRTYRMLRTTMEGAGTDNLSAIFEFRELGETTILDDGLFTAAAGS